ncbi:MAG: FliA/WhiG family RNA polymerase sigma factor [Terriglobia bacterium]
MSESDREKLILDHIPQVRLIARKLHERLPDTIMLEDLFSAGVLGLIAAIDNYDPAQNVKLRTYAEFRIRGAMLDSLRESDWAPRLKRRMARELEAGVARAEQRLGRVAEEAEIAAELNLTVEVYRQNLNDVAALDIGELEFTGEGAESSDSSGMLRYVSTPDEDSPALQLERRELERLIASSIDGIPKVEKTVLSLYFYEELNLREIGEILGLHFSRVSQIKTQAVLRLRNSIGKKWPHSRGGEPRK